MFLRLRVVFFCILLFSNFILMFLLGGGALAFS